MRPGGMMLMAMAMAALAHSRRRALPIQFPPCPQAPFTPNTSPETESKLAEAERRENQRRIEAAAAKRARRAARKGAITKGIHGYSH